MRKLVAESTSEEVSKAKVKLNLEHSRPISRPSWPWLVYRGIKYHEMKRFLANMSLSTQHPPRLDGVIAMHIHEGVGRVQRR